MTESARWAEDLYRKLEAERHADPGAPLKVRVRMKIDLDGQFGVELSRVAEQLGKTREELVREGLGHVYKALRARRGAPFVGRP